MNKKSISNFKYSIISQLIVIVFGIIRALAIPVLLGVTEFGYWQIYLLYAGFVGVFTFGFNDGIYLRYGDKHNSELPWEKLRGAFSLYFLLLFVTSALLLFFVQYTSINPEKTLSFVYVILNVGLMGATSLFLFLFQSTNQIKKYSVYMLVDKLLFVVLLLVLYCFSNVSFEVLMIIDCLSKLLLVIAMTINCRRDLFGGAASFLASFDEFYTNISVGIKLMLANLAGMLVINMSRFFVEQYYTLEEFSTFSFGISLTNIVLMAMNGVSVALYPFLKRLAEEGYREVYSELTDAVTLLLIFALFAYYPIYYFILNEMSAYSEVLSYFNVLFVCALLQIKMNVIITTFYKVLRKEKELLKANIVCIVLGLSLSSLVVLFDKTIGFMALALFVTITFRVYRSDFFINNIFENYNFKKVLLELTIFIVFIVVTHTMPVNLSFLLLFIFTISYTYTRKSKVRVWFNIFKGSK